MKNPKFLANYAQNFQLDFGLLEKLMDSNTYNIYERWKN